MLPSCWYHEALIVLNIRDTRVGRQLVAAWCHGQHVFHECCSLLDFSSDETDFS